MSLWGDFVGWISGADSTDRSAQLDQQAADYNASTGYYDTLTPAAAQAAQQHLADQYAATADQSAQMSEAFAEGAKQGLDAEVNFVHGALDTVGGAVWKAIPWWVWLGGAIALFVYLGGGVWIRKQLTR